MFLTVRFLWIVCLLLAIGCALGWGFGLVGRLLAGPLLLFSGLTFLGWAGGAHRRRRTLNDRARPR